MEIPYTVKPRPDTGLYNAKVGIWLFLASEVMLFGALFSSYVLLRVGAPPGTWVQGVLNIPLGAVNTMVLIVSSVTVVMAWASLKLNQYSKFRMYMGITILCALTFMGIKSFEYKSKWNHYEVWLKDGAPRPEGWPEGYDSWTGHIEGDPYFWNTATLNDPESPIDQLVFETDSHHYNHVKWIKGREHPFQVHADADHAGAEAAPAGDAAHGGEAAGAGDHGAEGEAHAAEHAGGHSGGKHGPTLTIPSSSIKRLSAFVPAHSTYFAIYFTMTGLHAAHVVGGAIVLAYFGIFGGALWRKDPEHLANRVEVGGLFWHFVDLVWIFLFPILYLL